MSDLTELAFSTASKFLHTAVIFDDHAYQDDAEILAERIELETDGLPGYAPELAEIQPSPELEADTNRFETEVVVEGFADLGINCAVLAPSSHHRADDQARLRNLARRADIVVLDWIIEAEEDETGQPGPTNSDGTSFELLKEILSADRQSGSHLRLICVYTGDRRLSAVFDRIAEGIDDGSRRLLKDADSRTMTLSGTRIVVLAKPGTDAVPGLQTIPFALLPKRAVEEFSAHAASGILPKIALSAIAAIRDGAHRVLGRFDSALDPAVLTHRALTSTLETEQFLLSIIGDELSALVLSDYDPMVLSEAILEAHIEESLSRGGTLEIWKKHPGSAGVPVELQAARLVLLSGVDQDGIIQSAGDHQRFKDVNSFTSLTDRMPADVAESERLHAERIDLMFSALSSLSRDRVYDGDARAAPDLHLGTLLVQQTPPSEDGAKVADQYWMCLQPICDSARLEGPTKFALLPLQKSKENLYNFDLVADEAGSYRRLSLGKAKLNTVNFVPFEPDKLKEQIVAGWQDGWRFVSTSGEVYTWLGDVRLDKAHKLVAEIVSNASRIGINEYEYFRRSASR